MAYRTDWIVEREGDAVVTQLHYAAEGVVTPEMEHVAGDERLEPETVRAEIAAGRLIVPANVRHPEVVEVRAIDPDSVRLSLRERQKPPTAATEDPGPEAE